VLLTSGSLGRARFGFTDRWGGASTGPYAELNLARHVGDDRAAVDRNRAALLAALPGARSLAFMSQVHGSTVAVVGPDRDTADPPEADVLVTAEPGVALVVLTADCVPVLLAGAAGGAVAAVHAGRRGVEGGAVAAAMAVLEQQGVRRETVAAVVGPAVCGPCYEVPVDLQRAVSSEWPAAAATSRRGTPALDLPAAVELQLREEGVGNVTRLAVCTVESPELFSHRRDGVTGRIAGVVWLPDE
jgi:hypothetical protein